MQDLRIILIILGAVAIAALLIHGLWTSQKGRQKPMREKPLSKVANNTPEQDDDNLDRFDRDGIGRVSVAGHHQAESLSRAHDTEDDWQISSDFSALPEDEQHEPSLGLPPTLSSSVFSEELEDSAYDNADTQFVTASERDVAPASAPAEQGKPLAKVDTEQESVAELRARQYRQGEIDPLFDNHEFDDHQSDNHEFNNQEPTPSPTDAAVAPLETENSAPKEPVEEVIEPVVAKTVPKTWQDVYVINVMAKPNQVLGGTELMRAVTDAGFVFGDMDIFHRYQGSVVQGEPMFSLANMVNPGTFNPNGMSEFTSPGVSIFMQLPKPGMAKSHFNMMVQAADNIAEDLDAILLDGQRQPLALDYLVRCRSQLNDFDSQAQ